MEKKEYNLISSERFAELLGDKTDEFISFMQNSPEGYKLYVYESEEGFKLVLENKKYGISEFFFKDIINSSKLGFYPYIKNFVLRSIIEISKKEIP